MPTSPIAPSLLARLLSGAPGGELALRALNKLGGSIWPRRRFETYFGATMECDTRDLIQGRIALFGVWEPDVAAVFHDAVRPGDVVVDIGANIGFFSLLSSNLVGPDGAVVAIEASPTISRRLKHNLELNDAENVRVATVAVSDRRGELVLYAGPSTNIGRTTTIKSRGLREVERVAALPLDEVLSADELRRVSLIKIDIEGAERPVLTRLLDKIDSYPRHLNVLVEASSHEDPAGWDQLFRRFVDAGFEARAVENRYDWRWYMDWRQRSTPRPLDELPLTQTDIWFSRPDHARTALTAAA